MDALWQLPVISGPVPWIVYAIAIASVVVLLARKPTLRWVLTAVIGIAAGGILGLGIYLIANAVNAFGNPLPLEVGLWAGAAFAGVGLAIASLWRSPMWRKIVASLRDHLVPDHRDDRHQRVLRAEPDARQHLRHQRLEPDRHPDARADSRSDGDARQDPSTRRGRLPRTCRRSVSRAPRRSRAPCRGSMPATPASTCLPRPSSPKPPRCHWSS